MERRDRIWFQIQNGTLGESAKLWRFGILQLLQFIQDLITAATGNPNAPTPNPHLTVLQALYDDGVEKQNAFTAAQDAWAPLPRSQKAFSIELLRERLAPEKAAGAECTVVRTDFLILRARPDDSATLTEIAFAAKRHWGYPERWIVKWANLLTIDPRLIADQETYVAYVDGVPVGFYSLKARADRMNLEHLLVLPDAMGHGVGRALFVHAVQRMKASGREILEIESDPHALGFYERMGARRAGATVTKWEGQPRELPVLIYKIDHAA